MKPLHDIHWSLWSLLYLFFSAFNHCNLHIPPLDSHDQWQIKQGSLIRRTIRIRITAFELVPFRFILAARCSNILSHAGCHNDQTWVQLAKHNTRLLYFCFNFHGDYYCDLLLLDYRWLSYLFLD